VNRRKALVAILSSALAASAPAGCASNATTTAYTPITGIIIDSSDLTAGFGCGTDPGQVYEYAALLSYSDDAGVSQAPVYSLVSDCYSDGRFSNLPPSSSGSLGFQLTILAWDQASFPAALRCFPPTPTNPDSTYPCPGDDVATVLSSQGTPNWSTTCSAAQQEGVSALAICAPLVPAGSATSVDGGVGDHGDAGEAATTSD
jgi:hypothetical protein